MPETTTTFDNLVKIFCDAGRYADTSPLRSGLRAVIQALVDESPSKETLQSIYDEYGLTGVRDYILGVDNLLPNRPVNMPPQYWELHAKYKDLQNRFEELLRTVDVIKQENIKAKDLLAQANAKALSTAFGGAVR